LSISKKKKPEAQVFIRKPAWSTVMPSHGLMVRVRVNSTCLGKITLDSEDGDFHVTTL